ncbi:uncharacterized protein BDV14DRAFT_198973 [Aspergillus stella-maris]|uniref:uncharacterized protein n=1 Tax=Aspergillus stella-maris TaxID=1810926 RepID=UPI003CCD4257
MPSFLQLTPPQDVVSTVKTKPSENASNNIEAETETMTGTNNGDEINETTTAERNHRERIKSLVVEAEGQHLFTTILLHGFGTNGQIFGEEFMRKTQMAKHIPNVSVHGARHGSLFMLSLGDTDLDNGEQIDGLQEAAKEISELIAKEAEVFKRR